jgi:hypothetical protein
VVVEAPMRQLIRILGRPVPIVVAVAFILLAWFLIHLPSLYARIKLDRSFPTLSRYAFENTPNVILVGSSMTFRIKEEYFAKVPVRNIAISGGSPLTGLAIADSYRSVPRLALVEINIMLRATDQSLVEQFGKNDVAPYQWFWPVRAVISFIYRWIKADPGLKNAAAILDGPPSNYDIAASVELSAKQYGETNFDAALVKNIHDLRPLVDDLERRGCRIVFYELPYPDRLGDTHYANLARSLMHAAFPDDERWPKLDFPPTELRWVDAAHMDERSAILVAKEIEKHIEGFPVAKEHSAAAISQTPSGSQPTHQ